MSDSNIKNSYAKGILNETYSSRDNLKKFMYIADDEITKFCIYGMNKHAKYYAKLSDKQLFPQIEFIVNDSEEVIKELSGYKVLCKSDFIEYLKKNIELMKVIVFSDNYSETVKELQNYGLNPFNQIFDGRYIFDLRELDNKYVKEKDNISRIIFTIESFRTNKGGLFVYDTELNTYKLLMQGDFRGLVRFKNGYLTLDDQSGLIYFNSDFEVERQIKIEGADLHGLDIYEENSSYAFVAETEHDRISVFDVISGAKVEQIDMGERNSLGSSPGMYHINDILVNNEEILISMLSIRGLFNRGAFKDDGAIVSLDRRSYTIDRVYAEKLNSPHSLIRVGNDLLFCDSAKGRVYCNERILHQVNCYARGLYFNGYSLYIGQNIPRHLPYLLQISSCFSNDTGIHSYVPSRRVSTFMPFPFLGQIYNIITE